MKRDENRLYVNLTCAGMYLSSTTAASRSHKLSCGDRLPVEVSVFSAVTIERCQLSPDDFRSHRLAHNLDPQAYAERYGLTLKAVLRYEGISDTKT